MTIVISPWGISLTRNPIENHHKAQVCGAGWVEQEMSCVFQ